MGSWATLQKHHDPRHEAVTGPLEDIEECGKKGGTNNDAECPAFQHVYEVQGGGNLVETVALLEDEGFI